MEINENETLTNVNSNINLIQKKGGLTFGTDAYLLSAFVRREPSSVACDFGTGTGIISLLLAVHGAFSKIYAIDVQPDFYDITRRNIEVNGFEDKIEAINCDVRDFKKECDAVFCNPPYMKADSGRLNQSDAKRIARHEIYGDINDFISSAARVLKFGGLFYVVYRPDRMTDLFSAMRDNKIEPKRLTFVYPDVDHEPCMILCEGKRGAKPSLFVTKPLLISDNGEDSDDMKYIYEMGEFGEQFKK